MSPEYRFLFSFVGQGRSKKLYYVPRILRYYLGSSISGTVGGLFWMHYGWNGVAAMTAILIVAAFGVSAMLLRMPVVE